MIRLETTFTGWKMAIEHVEKVVKYVEGPGKKDVTIAAFNAAGSIFEKNFDSEGVGFGVGGWADLADSTVKKREALGFSGSHPILVRYNDLRTITATSLRIAGGSGTFSATDPQGRRIEVSLNISEGNSWAVASGEKALNQNQTKYAPARPFWFTTKTVQFAVRRRAVETLADKIEKL